MDVADALINHARYNEVKVNKYLPADHKWIVPIREPESWFKSAVTYFKNIAKRKVKCCSYLLCHILAEFI